MFDRTRFVIDQTIRDVKRLGEIFGIVTQTSYIAYLVYALIADSGNIVVNAILLGLSVAFFIFSLIANDYLKKHDKSERNAMRKTMYVIKRIYTHSKLIAKLFPLGVSLYSIYLTSGNVTPFTLISVSLTLVSWVLQIITDLLVHVFNKKKDLFMEAFKADVDTLLAPAKTVGNFFKKITGQEPQEDASKPSKKLQKIEEKLQFAKEEKKREKLQKQAEKEQKRQEALEEKKRFFRSLKKEQELMRSSKNQRKEMIETQDESDESDGQV